MTEAINHATPSRPPPGEISPWRFYLVSVACFGFYLPFWVYRTARQFRIGGRGKSGPIWWAVGSLIAPVAAALLYEFNRRALAGKIPRRAAAMPALAYLALFVVWALTPLSDYFLTLPLLAPAPFVFVQRNINRAGSTTALAARPLRAPHWVALIVGSPILLIVAWFVDIPTLTSELAHRIASGAGISGRSQLYELTAPEGGWRRVASGTIGDNDSDLELVGPGDETWVVAYVHDVAEFGLEEVVTNRRDLVFGEGTPRVYNETRYFLPDADHVPVSLASHDVNLGLLGTARYVVLTVELHEHLVELVGFTSQPQDYGSAISELLTSFRDMEGEARPS